MAFCPTEASGTAAGRRYTIRTLAFMAGYVAVNVAAIFGAFDDVKAPGSYALALIVAAPVIGQLWATLKLIEESDEFVRALMTKRMILASGLAIAAASAWGFMESYAGAPHLPGWLVYPLFWGFFGVVSPFVRSTR
ncbi:MAG: hypothetical protein BGN86_13240 [Caulobacterales bacterium 68-7]|nr:hypothetical protein [Caulobacterales bacterium]OJU13312.1 MAG: hypothetical protein BGN86_13240 [Caulobacterales bacterium 68-7]